MNDDLQVATLDVAKRAWGLEDARIIADTATSRVYRVRWGAGDAVLKILKPYGADEIGGLRYIEWLGGQGAARIYRLGPDAALMEYLKGPALGDRLRRDGDDAGATDVLCAVARTLHNVPACGAPVLERLDIRFAPLLTGEPAAWPEASRSHMERAQELARKLLAGTGQWRPVHGDLHHDNIMASARGWLAIDAKGVLGDPAYEFANVFRNPYGMAALALNSERIMRLRDRIAEATGLARERLVEWAAAHCALSACWNMASGNPIDFDMKLLPRLLDAVDQSRFSKKKSGYGSSL